MHDDAMTGEARALGDALMAIVDGRCVDFNPRTGSIAPLGWHWLARELCHHGYEVIAQHDGLVTGSMRVTFSGNRFTVGGTEAFP